MNDSDQQFVRMRERASDLCHRIDDAVSALMAVSSAVHEVARSDLDVAGELAVTDHEDLVRCVDDATFSTRTAERIALEHLDDVRRAAAGEIRRP